MLEDTPSTTPTPAWTDGLVDSLAAARPRLLRLARLRGVPTSQQEDVVQETLLTAWRSLANLRDPNRFDAWLDGILRNLCRHATIQTESAASDPLDTLDDFDVSPAELDPLDDLTQRELAGLIDAALGHLRESARQALELRYLAELPADEVAARLGVTLNTLDARLSRARRQLRDTLNGPLRTQALDLGLALGPADDTGWRDSRIWCRFCGEARMQGILEDAEDGVGGRMVLRCPVCYQRSGADDTNIASFPLLRGLSSFRAANKRLVGRAQATIPYLIRSATPCMSCGAPVRGRVIGHGMPEHAFSGKFPNHFFVIIECPHCGLSTSGAAGVVGVTSPDITRFFIEARRLLVEPEVLDTYETAPAIRFSLLDRATNERLIYFGDPNTLDLLHYERRL